MTATVSGKTLISAPLSRITENSADLTVTIMRGADPSIIREGIIIMDGSSVWVSVRKGCTTSTTLAKGHVSASTVSATSGRTTSSVKGPSSVGAVSTDGLSRAEPSTTGTAGGTVGTEPGCPMSDSGDRFPRIGCSEGQKKVSVAD